LGRIQKVCLLTQSKAYKSDADTVGKTTVCEMASASQCKEETGHNSQDTAFRRPESRMTHWSSHT